MFQENIVILPITYIFVQSIDTFSGEIFMFKAMGPIVKLRKAQTYARFPFFPGLLIP